MRDLIIARYSGSRNRVIAVAVAVGSGVLLLSYWAGQQMRFGFSRWVLLLVGGVGVVGISLVALRRMSTALTFLVLTAAVVDVGIGTGTAATINVAMMFVGWLTAVWMLRMLVRERRLVLVPNKLNFPLIGFLLVALISWIASSVVLDWHVPLPGNALLVQGGQYAIFLLTVAAFLLAANHEVSQTSLKWWTGFLIAIGFAAILFEVVAQRKFPLSGVTGALLMWPIVLLLSQMFFNPNLRIWHHIAGWLAVIVWGYWALAREFNWKGSWVPALLGALLLLWFKSKRAFVVVVAVVIVLVVANFDVVYPRTFLPEQQVSSILRPQLWYDVSRMAGRSLLLGLGPVNYYYYWDDPTFIPVSRLAAGWDTWNQWGYRPPSHNMFVDIFAQTGLVGLGLFLWAAIAGVRLGLRVRHQFTPGFTQAYIYGVLCGFVSMLVISGIFAEWLLPFVYNIGLDGFRSSVYVWLLMGTLVSLGHGVRCDQISGVAQG